MPRRNFPPLEDPEDAPESPSEAPRGEFRSEAQRPASEAPKGIVVSKATWERVGMGAHYDTPKTEEPETHDVGQGRVLTDTVGKFDGRTGGMPLIFKAGTPVTDLPRWLAEEVMGNDRLHAEA